MAIAGGFDAAHDRLSVTSAHGITGSYNTSTGVLTLSGSATAADYQDVLRSITYASTSAVPSTADRTVTFNVAGGLYNPDNGHFYQFVRDPGITWTDAKAAADASNLYGLQGYLATLTSAAENEFAFSKTQSTGWIGASDANTPGHWQWADGPEQGLEFWQGDGTTGTPVNGQYNDWNLAEPNNSGNVEFYAQYLQSGLWNDLSNTATVNGYLIEYGGSQNDPTLQVVGSTTVHVAADLTPPTITATTASPASGAHKIGDTITLTLSTSEAVLINGTPKLTLNNGGTATYDAAHSTPTSLAFTTTIAAGQNTSALAVTGVTLPSGATIKDAAGNDADLTGAGATFSGLSVDATAPTLTALTTTADPTHATSLTYTVTFSEAVSGVTAGAFTLHDANGNVVPGTIGTPSSTDGGLTYTVTVSGLTGDGTVHLDFNASGSGITDTVGNALTGGGATGTSVTLDHGVPAVTLAFSAGSGADNHALPTDPASGALVLNAGALAAGFYLGGTSSDANPGPGARVTFLAADGHVAAQHDVPFINGEYAFRIDAQGTIGGVNGSVAATLVDGTYTVVASTQDAAGNIGHTVAQTLVIDTTADAGHDAALTLDDTADHVINAAEARAVGFTVAGLDADATAVATFTDGTHTVTAAVGANGAGTVDLSGFVVTVTSSLAIVDAHQNSATVAGSEAQINTAVPVLPALSVAGTGVANTLSGNVLADGAAGVPLHLASVQASNGIVTAIAGSGPTQVVGAHGTLTVAADGSYSYQASGHGHDVFTETVMDAAGNATQTTLSFDVAAQVTQAFRFYDAATGAHVFTTDAGEAAQIQASLPTLQTETTPWTTPDKGTDTTDVFRFYDTVTHDHFLTTSTTERDAIQAHLPTLQYEGVAFQAYANEGASGTEALERFFNTVSKTHMYALASEADGILHGSAGAGWIDEGKAFVVHTGTDAHA